ncbi:retron St85 family RNA-directed DNA polymerase [Humidesulfovibrio sp.]
MPNHSITWKAYYQRFIRTARRDGYSQEHIASCIAYAKRVYDNGFPIIFSPKHLCLLLGYSPLYVMGVSNAPENYYRRFTVPKKSGGAREISEPLPSLKEIQRWILDYILVHFQISPYAKAFRTGHSIKSNAKFHRNQAIVLNLDIQDFFGSIHGGIVFNLFRSAGYSRPVATVLTNVCILNDSLPQGAPTSPALSNIVMTSFDARISAYCQKRSIRYTRYADDITFSGDFDSSQLIKFVTMCLSKLHLNLNESKTRILGRNSQQKVTGIVVNEFLQAPRLVRRSLRQSIHYIEKFGLPSYMRYKNILRTRHIEHLLGIANFILYLNPSDRDAIHARSVLLPLLRERNMS